MRHLCALSRCYQQYAHDVVANVFMQAIVIQCYSHSFLKTICMFICLIMVVIAKCNVAIRTTFAGNIDAIAYRGPISQSQFDQKYLQSTVMAEIYCPVYGIFSYAQFGIDLFFSSYSRWYILIVKKYTILECL